MCSAPIIDDFYEPDVIQWCPKVSLNPFFSRFLSQNRFGSNLILQESLGNARLATIALRLPITEDMGNDTIFDGRPET